MMYPTPYDVLPMAAGETYGAATVIDGQGTCGVQAQRDPDGGWRDVQVVVGMAWEDLNSGQSRLTAYSAAR